MTGRATSTRCAGRRAAAALCSGRFDLLFLDGEDLRPLPIEVRRERLTELLANHGRAMISFSEHSDADGTALFAAACRMNLEGIVVKRKGSRYKSGRCRRWLKIKNPGCVRS